MLIPDNINHFISQGERLLYFKFKNEETVQQFYILHSVFTNYHLNNISGELDFLVLAPGMGIFAIEVKHGGVSREKGTWLYENRSGKINQKKKSPFSQVHGTMHSIRQYILDQVSHDKSKYERLKNLLFGTGVAFTSMVNKNIDFGPEAFPWQVLTREGLSLPIRKYLNTLSDGWHNEYQDKYWYDVNKSRPTSRDCELVLKILRGDLNIDYTEINRISDNEKIIEEFTKEQFYILNFVNFNDRCLIEGQAGTGKTVLALELVKRRLKKDEKVGFFCFNNQLGQKLNKTISNNFTSTQYDYCVGTLHSYMLNNTDVAIPKSDKSKFYSETLPLEFLIQNEGILYSDQFDFLVIDEVQDLLTNYYLEVIDFILEGGVDRGRWVMFGDFSNQAIYLNNPFEALENLKRRTHFTKLPPLNINCRNTKRISNQNSLLTGIDLPEFTNQTLIGESITVKFPAKNKQKKVVEEVVESLLDKEIPITKITLLSPKRVSNNCLSDSDYIADLKKDGLTVTTIQSFKGLEDAIVVLYDFDEISSEKSRKLLYVGISRATQRLLLILDNSLKQDYQKIVRTNLSKTD